MRTTATMLLAAPLALSMATAPAVPVTSYREAEKLYDAGRYGEALELFRQVYAETESAAVGMFVARCLRELGQLPEAHDEMTKIARAKCADTPDGSLKRVFCDVVRTELAEIRRQVGRVTVVVAASERQIVRQVVRQEVCPFDGCGGTCPRAAPFYWGLVSAGIGVAGLATFAATGTMALDRYDERNVRDGETWGPSRTLGWVLATEVSLSVEP